MTDFADTKQLLDLLQKLDPSSTLSRRTRELLNDRLEVAPPIPKPTNPSKAE